MTTNSTNPSSPTQPIDDKEEILSSALNELSFSGHQVWHDHLAFYNVNEDKVADYIDSQPEITPRLRANLVDWLIKVHKIYELTYETLYLTINIIDRFLAAETIPFSELQCVGMTALHIASKYIESRESEDTLLVKEFLKISGGIYEHQHVLDTELRILDRLEWKLNVPTMYFYLTWFIKVAEYPPETNMENMMYFYAELGMMNYETLRFCPSMVAAAAVYAARATFNKSDIWHKTLEMQTGFKEIELLECAKLMVLFHLVAKDDKKRPVIYEKYSSLTRGAVALYEPAESLLADANNT